MGSAGGVVAQPALGRAADVYGYAASYVIAGGVQALAIPFAFLARRTNAASDPITPDGLDSSMEQPLGVVAPPDPAGDAGPVVEAGKRAEGPPD